VDLPASFEGDFSSPALWDSEDERAMGFRLVPVRPGEAAREWNIITKPNNSLERTQP
jgi:hypothetical protein